MGQHINPLAILEKLVVPDCMGTGGVQSLHIGHISADIVGYTAASVRDEIVPVHKCDLSIRHEALDPAGHFGAQGYGADDHDFFAHESRSLLSPDLSRAGMI
jgi:hypothetical protein